MEPSLLGHKTSLLHSVTTRQVSFLEPDISFLGNQEAVSQGQRFESEALFPFGPWPCLKVTCSIMFGTKEQTGGAQVALGIKPTVWNLPDSESLIQIRASHQYPGVTSLNSRSSNKSSITASHTAFSFQMIFTLLASHCL